MPEHSRSLIKVIDSSVYSAGCGKSTADRPSPRTSYSCPDPGSSQPAAPLAHSLRFSRFKESGCASEAGLGGFWVPCCEFAGSFSFTFGLAISSFGRRRYLFIFRVLFLMLISRRRLMLGRRAIGASFLPWDFLIFLVLICSIVKLVLVV